MKKQNHIPDHGITFFQAFKVWLRVALLSFGGPAGQISVMHRILVDQKRWIDEGRFLHALNYCMLFAGARGDAISNLYWMDPPWCSRGPGSRGFICFTWFYIYLDS